jgi:RNA polymerase sigma factor (sigma-70 family)
MHPNLTADDDEALGRRVRAGDLAARNELVRRHQSFALYIANLYKHRCRCRDDLYQAARLGLIEGANAYDPDNHPGTRFLSIARYYVRMEILAYLYSRPLVRIPHSARPRELARRPLAANVKPKCKEHRAWTEICVAKAARVVQGHDEELDHVDPSQCFQSLDDSHAEDLEQLRLGLEVLPSWDAEIIRRHFGLGRPKQSARTIARETGISRQSVSSTKKLALQQLRKAMRGSISA